MCYNILELTLQKTLSKSLGKLNFNVNFVAQDAKLDVNVEHYNPNQFYASPVPDKRFPAAIRSPLTRLESCLPSSPR
jgi:hypothetical protein